MPHIAGRSSAPPPSCRRWFLGLAALLAACSKPAPTDAPQEGKPASTTHIEAEPATLRKPVETCEHPVPVFDGGKRVESLCPSDLAARGLTVIDLSDDWAPRLFSEDPELGAKGQQSYRAAFLALENERFGEGPEWDRARQDRYLELYGIFPSPSVMRDRLLDDERHHCHETVDDAALERLAKPLDPWRDAKLQQSDRAFAKTLLKKLEMEKKRRGVASIDDLKNDPYFKATWEQYQRVGTQVDAIRGAQAHLRCDHLLSNKAEDGVFDYGTTEALKAFQRKHMIVSWRLDDETKKALVTDSRELDFRGLLRTLRERIIDATGLIEDGTARGAPGKVVDRVLDSEAFRALGERGPIENGAPDLVSAATDAAARALGWTGPAEARAFLEAGGRDSTRSLRVAVKLPPAPAYHGPAMELRAEIDRGDVWYDFPYTKHGDPNVQFVGRRPTVVLYAKDGDHEVALMRWPTTVGGWKPERVAKRKLAMVYKESPEGDRVWRDLIASPVWVPPESAPKRDLIRPRPGGGWATKQDVFGPGYASAYGLMMLIHHRVAQIKNDKDPLKDQGIRTHGSVSYDSIDHGTSHGCHRLFNHMAVRLGDFLLAHRKTIRHGAIELGYGRTFAWEGKSMTLSFDSRGYRYELDPPVPVQVLRGRIMGTQTSPILEPKPLPDALAERFTQERWED